jgi:hypothetical protein
MIQDILCYFAFHVGWNQPPLASTIFSKRIGQSGKLRRYCLNCRTWYDVNYQSETWQQLRQLFSRPETELPRPPTGWPPPYLYGTYPSIGEMTDYYTARAIWRICQLTHNLRKKPNGLYYRYEPAHKAPRQPHVTLDAPKRRMGDTEDRDRPLQ